MTSQFHMTNTTLPFMTQSTTCIIVILDSATAATSGAAAGSSSSRLIKLYNNLTALIIHAT